MSFDVLPKGWKKDLDRSVSKEEADRAFQALSALMIIVLILIFQPSDLNLINDSKPIMNIQASLYLFALLTTLIASRFLFKKAIDIERIDLYGAYWIFFTVMIMLFGVTFTYFGHRDVYNIWLMNLIGFNILLISEILTLFLLLLFGSRALIFWSREYITGIIYIKKIEKKEPEKKLLVPEKNKPTLKPKIKNFWFWGAVIAFAILWGLLLNFYPFSHSDFPSNLPTNETIIKGEMGEAIGLKCLRGEAFEDTVVQGDMLRCRIKFYNFNMSYIENGFSVSIYTASQIGNVTVGENIPLDDFEKNRGYYTVNLNLSDFSQNETEFLIKVPPTNRFYFFISGISGYYNIPILTGYTTTKFDDYVKNTYPKIQLLFLIFGVFVTAKYMRDLWKNE